jgi:hypothetical protein
LLIAVITGGRPLLSDRPSRRLFSSLSTLGDIEYVVREDQASGYEPDPLAPLNIYPVSWADQYACTHWRHPRATFQPGGFHGAFTGREWAMRTAEERGYDLVLQLDDNILWFGPVDATRTAHYRDIIQPADSIKVMMEMALSTNLSMFGAQLTAVQRRGDSPVARVGFPYSCFLEKTGPGRMPYYGPFEDDIMHAMEYGLNGGPGRTAGLTQAITYYKEAKSKTGMRKHYNPERGLELARRYPNNARLIEGPGSSSPTAIGRAIRHQLNTKGFTSVQITDRPRFEQARADLGSLVGVARERLDLEARKKIARRAGRAEA